MKKLTFRLYPLSFLHGVAKSKIRNFIKKTFVSSQDICTLRLVFSIVDAEKLNYLTE